MKLNSKTKFNGKFFLEQIYVKSVDEKKEKSEIRQEIMKKLKVSRQSLSLWVNGKLPGIDNLFMLKEYFGLPDLECLVIQGGSGKK